MSSERFYKEIPGILTNYKVTPSFAECTLKPFSSSSCGIDSHISSLAWALELSRAIAMPS
jgi:hypothetical protein